MGVGASAEGTRRIEALPAPRGRGRGYAPSQKFFKILGLEIVYYRAF